MSNRLVSESAETRAAMLLKMAEEDGSTPNIQLYWIFGGSIIFTGFLSGFLVSLTSDSNRVVNMLTVLVGGFCTAKNRYWFLTDALDRIKLMAMCSYS